MMKHLLKKTAVMLLAGFITFSAVAYLSVPAGQTLTVQAMSKKEKTAYNKNFGALKTGDIIFQVPYSRCSDGSSTSGTHALLRER